MDKVLIIEGTETTPYVNFNTETGIFYLKGNSFAYNSYTFYYPIIEWLKVYAKTPHNPTILHVQLNYFNTSASKYIFSILGELEMINLIKDFDTIVKWYYKDDDMLEIAEDYNDILETSFEYIPIIYL